MKLKYFQINKKSEYGEIGFELKQVLKVSVILNCTSKLVEKGAGRLPFADIAAYPDKHHSGVKNNHHTQRHYCDY